jgi:hypothetical protein
VSNCFSKRQTSDKDNMPLTHCCGEPRTLPGVASLKAHRVLWCVVAILLASHPASAQIFESVGTRAQGMAGAFVAVADDASATWWNPAGLATGAYFSALVERDFAKSPNDDNALGVAVAVPSLGVSYYRTRISVIPAAGSTDAAMPGRQDQAVGLPLPTFVVNQWGLTFGQSLGSHLVVASTPKIVRADDTHVDLDLGAMVRFGRLRAAAVVKHLHEPDLTVEGTRVGFDRQVRLGLAFVQPSSSDVAVNAALDADLTSTSTAFGNARHLAGGAELWARHQLGLRAGVSVNTIDELRPALSVGASVAARRGVFVDARLTRGDDEAIKGWGFDLRVTF